MSQLMLTIGIAFAVVLLAIALLAISWLLTGRSTMRPGACGRDPNKKRDEKEGCGSSTSCDLCEKPDEVKKKK